MADEQIEWTGKEVVARVETVLNATVEGLQVQVKDDNDGYVRWNVYARLDDFSLLASPRGIRKLTVKEAQAQAVAAARRLAALGAVPRG